MKKKYYIAYGSNLSVEQMADRCPDAKVVGTAVLHGWQLLFKGCATIEPNPDRDTPVLIWEISERDEQRLDRYEGFPAFYYKKRIRVKLHSTGKTAIGLVYIMHEERQLGIPDSHYFNNIREIYNHHNWDEELLWAALDKSIDDHKRRAKKH